MTKIGLPETEKPTNKPPENEMKMDQELNNPCLQEHFMSLKCLDNNNYVQKRCEPFFENYRLCKKFWANVMADRKSKGIKPLLPLPAERSKVKAEYLNTLYRN
ncbi:coiled-coil-helix-coiled-coil-helix domain-containing protein 7 [Lasioglossum baleicum]|uniref:coiled-coil-helix-coiled-coil-helix domain-containing protein 7 n=1 Tax=Lasioglossum baleicum TaxID=434251 RepID=UPI003FCCC582